MASHTFPVQDRRPFRLVDSSLWSRCLWGEELGRWKGISNGYFLGKWQFSICTILGNLVWALFDFKDKDDRLRAVAGDILLVNWLMGSHWPLGEPGNQDLPCVSLWGSLLVFFFIALSQLVLSLWFKFYEVSAVEVAVLLEVSVIFGQLVGEMARWLVESRRFLSFIDLKAPYCFWKIGGLLNYWLRQVFRQNVTSGEWEWSQGPQLNHARYGHCATQVLQTNHVTHMGVVKDLREVVKKSKWKF